MPQSHPSQKRRESGILAHGIELHRGRDQNQRAVPLVEGAVQPVEKAHQIREAEVHEGDPHRRDVVLRRARCEFLEQRLRPIAVSRATIGVAEDTDVIDRPAAQLDRLLESREGPVVPIGLRARITQRIVREGEGRLERQDPFELLDGAIEVVTEIVEVANQGFHLKIERVQSPGLLQLVVRPVILPLEKQQPPGI